MNNKLLMLVAAATVATSSMQGSSYLPTMPSQKSVESAATTFALVGGGLYLGTTLLRWGCNSYRLGAKQGLKRTVAPAATVCDVKEVDAKVNALAETVVAVAHAENKQARRDAVKNWVPKSQQGHGHNPSASDDSTKV